MVTLALRSFPRAIIHIDADAFFAACEQARDPRLKGKPVVTGKERGIAAAVSYEARALGIKRGMRIHEIRDICPDVIHLPSDYETYSLYSVRMFSIVRRYTTRVEEYSIDECFAEITGLRRPRRMSYEAIAAHIKQELERTLGLTFSLGLAPSKVVAKIASKWQKPSGFTVITGKKLPQYLGKLAVGDVWGIGPQTAAHLAQFNIRTALDFALKEVGWVKQHLTKPHQEIWQELRGTAVLPLEVTEQHDYKSISKTKTFTPPSNDRTYVFAQLSKNIENACIKARRHHLLTRKVCFFLRTQAFDHDGYEITLTRATAFPNEIVRLVDIYFDEIFRPDLRYRLTGVIFSHLTEDLPVQLDLFDDVLKVANTARLYDCVDTLARKYGKHTLFLGSSLLAMRSAQHAGERADVPARKKALFKDETARKRLGLPMLGDVI